MHIIDDLKSQAKRMRNHFSTQAINLSHSQALEAIAAIHGYKDWNTVQAFSQPGEKTSLSTNESNESLDQALARAHEYAQVRGQRLIQPDGNRSLTPLTPEETKEVIALMEQLGKAVQSELADA